MKNAFIVVVAFAMLVSGARAADSSPSTTAAPAPPDIHVYSCKVVSGQSILDIAFEAGLAVRFQDNAAQPYKSIVWRAKYGDGYIDFQDDGTFSPQVRIDNFLLSAIGKAHVNVIGLLLMPRGGDVPVESQFRFAEYASLSDPTNCEIIKAVSNDGTTWTNPSIPAAHYVLPEPAPSTEATLAPGETAPQGVVDIAHCHLFFPSVHHSAEGDIGYRLDGGKPADSVTFRVSYGMGTIDLTDEGAFSDGVYVRHKLRGPLPKELEGRSFFSLDDPKNCSAVSVHYTDGTTWTNPSPLAAVAAPTPVPDALDSMLGKWIAKWQTGLRLAAPEDNPSPAPSTTP